MEYGTHVDDALTGGMRTDVAFTLFLNDPADYDRAFRGAITRPDPSRTGSNDESRSIAWPAPPWVWQAEARQVGPRDDQAGATYGPLIDTFICQIPTVRQGKGPELKISHK